MGHNIKGLTSAEDDIFEKAIEISETLLGISEQETSEAKYKKYSLT